MSKIHLKETQEELLVNLNLLLEVDICSGHGFGQQKLAQVAIQRDSYTFVRDVYHHLGDHRKRVGYTARVYHHTFEWCI